MKKVILIIVLIYSYTNIFSQIVISRQGQVDSFAINYPNLSIVDALEIQNVENLLGLSQISEIVDHIWITNTKVENLLGLENITNIGVFYIQDNNSLETLVGLSRLEEIVTGMSISNNNKLKDLTGLEKLSFSAELGIQGNEALISLEGLKSLIGTFGLDINNNNNLVSLKGLENFVSSDRLNISSNNKLNSLEGLRSFKSVSNLTIKNNPNLKTLSGLNKYFKMEEYMPILEIAQNENLNDCKYLCYISKGVQNLTIEGNGNGCNLNDLNFENCLNSIHGSVFYDKNENGKKEKEEYSVPNVLIHLQPESIDAKTNSLGNYRTDIFDDKDYTISPILNDKFKSTTISKKLVTHEEISKSTLVDFGITHAGNFHQIESSIGSNSPRCNEDVLFKLYLINSGSYIEHGKVIIRYDGYNEFTGKAIPVPDSIDRVRHLLYYKYQDFQPFEQKKFTFWLKMPGVEALDQFISNSGLIYNVENEDTILISHCNLREKIRCSFDPNDKTAYPFGEQNKHYTLKNDTLQYTIRFQNTGNAEAYNIKIRDTLSTHLNWNTFKVLHSSHTVETSLDNRNGAVTFAFDNIFLPDSTSNPTGSQGYVTYEIFPKENLPDNTLLKNTAYIYFDYNPAIITNTTFNTLVTEIPTGIKELETNSLLILPNPTSYSFSIDFHSNSNLEVEIIDITGQIIKKFDFKNDNSYSLHGIKNGLYFIQILDKKSKNMIGIGKIVKKE